MRGDNAKLRAIDKKMGWIDKDGKSPASIAEELDVAGHIITIGKGKNKITEVVWADSKVWSHCILHHYGLGTTLLARSRKGMVQLITQFHERITTEDQAIQWKPYYDLLWKTRYKKWCCSNNKKCQCQLCRSARG